MILAVDLMGSDASPKELFLAVVELSLKCDRPPIFHLYVDQYNAKELISSLPQKKLPVEIEFRVADQVVEMGDSPLEALKKERSSLNLAMRSLALGEVDAMITAGNSAAITLFARKEQLLEKGLLRPFLLATLPLMHKTLLLADVGANISCSAEQLLQFAEYTTKHFHTYFDKNPPRIALLNVGTEPYKGSKEHREAYRQLHSYGQQIAPPFAFIGNIEGRDLFTKEVDIVISDGFSGNVLLKTIEGTAKYVSEALLNEIEKNQQIPSFTALSHHFHYTNFSGALLAGVKGLVIKCHGSASYTSIQNSISYAIQLLNQSNSYK